MNFPKLTDLILYINKALTGADWNSNWQKVINWLTLGTYDLKVNKVETNEIENSGTFTQNGNLIADSIQSTTIQSDNFVGNGANLTNVKVADIFAYTPFSVNSAKANFVVNDTTKITFDIDEEHPLIVTSARGQQIKITSINDYDVSGLNGTYYVFVDENSNGGTAYLKSCTIYAQTTEPIGNNGDVWFDVSNEPYVCREKVSNNWYSDEYDKVPVAKVVITGGNIDSLDTLPFNQNGYQIDMGTSVLGVTFEAMRDRVSGTKDTVYHDDVYPTMVTYGSTISSVSNWDFRLQVSTDNANWKTISTGQQLDGGYVNTMIIGERLYWKFTTSLGSYTLYYSKIKGK